MNDDDKWCWWWWWWRLCFDDIWWLRMICWSALIMLMLYQTGKLRYCIWIHPPREAKTTRGAAAWLVDRWLWVACQVDDDCPVGITCNLVWGPSLEQNHLVVPFWVVNDWMMLYCTYMLDFFGGRWRTLIFCWNKTGKTNERRNFNFNMDPF